MDLGLLGKAPASRGSDRRRVTAAIAAVAGVMILDVISSVQLGRKNGQPDQNAAASFCESASRSTARSTRFTRLGANWTTFRIS